MHIIRTSVEFDPTKAKRNLLLHGVSFSDAEVALMDPMALTREDPDAPKASVAKRSSTMRKNYDFSKARRGAVLSSPKKTRITIMLDDDVLSYFRERGDSIGTGYQTLINETLRQSLSGRKTAARDARPVTIGELRRILREELKAS